ncbi:MAG: DUF1385 domain-containing protein, partial [Oscillospiraceae bacterium]|nr:DUF1385 domain-containing protein [Oscillospiraceae bacterium]
ISALAVRKPDGEINVTHWNNKPAAAWYRKTPFVRGIFNLGSSLSVGYKCLMRSANIAGFEEEPSKFEKWLAKKLGKHFSSFMSMLALVLGVALAIFLFTILPTLLTSLAAQFLPSDLARTVLEGVLRIAILITYMALVSLMPDIRRVFEYHGAEHKTIFCYERGKELTVGNVRTESRFHPRCGTSFLLIVLVVSILLFSALSWESVLTRILTRLAMLPVVVGIAYEIVKFTGRHDNAFTRFISAPGIFLQRITTKEPDDLQIEVAIASMKQVIPQEKGSDEW